MPRLKNWIAFNFYLQMNSNDPRLDPLRSTLQFLSGDMDDIGALSDEQQAALNLVKVIYAHYYFHRFKLEKPMNYTSGSILKLLI